MSPQRFHIIPWSPIVSGSKTLEFGDLIGFRVRVDSRVGMSTYTVLSVRSTGYDCEQFWVYRNIHTILWSDSFEVRVSVLHSLVFWSDLLSVL